MGIAPTHTAELITPAEVQKILRVSRSMVYRWASIGAIPCIRIPCIGSVNGKDLVRFKLSDVQEFIERHYKNVT